MQLKILKRHCILLIRMSAFAGQKRLQGRIGKQIVFTRDRKMFLVGIQN